MGAELQVQLIDELIKSGHGTRTLIREWSSQLPIFEPSLYHHDLGAEGYFSILCKKNGKPHQDSFLVHKMPEVLALIDRKIDSWISQNDFFRPNRRVVNLLSINTCFIDLDTYHTDHYKNAKPEKICGDILRYCEDNGFPLPSLILFSGRGLQIKWIFEKPLTPKALPRWNCVQKYLTGYFEYFGADKMARDASRVLRLERTVNTRSGEIVRILYPQNIDDTQKYTFDYLADIFLPWTREELREFKQKRKRKHKIKTQGLGLIKFDATKLNWDRLSDLRLLADIRGHNRGIPDGQRDLFIFLGSCFLAWVTDLKNLYYEVVAISREFCPTWSYSKTQNKASSVYDRYKRALKGEKIEYRGKLYDPRYTPTNNRLIDDLCIAPDEEKQMKTIISKNEKRRRDRERKHEKRHTENPDMLTREEYLNKSEERKKQAQNLRSQGLKYREIAEIMKTTVNAVDKLLRK